MLVEGGGGLVVGVWFAMDRRWRLADGPGSQNGEGVAGGRSGS
jgi:hypothetical protein